MTEPTEQTQLLSKYDLVKLIHRLLVLIVGWDLFAPEYKKRISDDIAKEPIEKALEKNA